jgi:cyclopropane fatty-acyl-phospholipid synthase-like methyltransferase
MAKQADRHALYERAVQDTESEFDFVDRTYKKLRGRRALSLREDFCGTAKMCCEWVKQRKTNTAIGVDLDKEVLDWGTANNVAKLKPKDQERISLRQADVLQVKTKPVDVILAMNFSYQLFKERATLRKYFRRVKNALTEDGVFFLDAFGGYDAYRDIKEKTKHKGFTYVWDQAHYNPITGEMVCHIHFKFPDGSELKPAFTYEWRLYTLPEIREILSEAGFRTVTIYWEGTDKKTNEGNGIYKPATIGTADPGWVCYITAEK